MATAPVSVVFLTQFAWSWNDLMFGLTFTKSFDVRPVMSALAQMGQQHLPALMLGCAVASIPTLPCSLSSKGTLKQGLSIRRK